MAWFMMYISDIENENFDLLKFHIENIILLPNESTNFIEVILYWDFSTLKILDSFSKRLFENFIY